MTESLPLLTRLWFAFSCAFRVIFDGHLAARLMAAASTGPTLPASSVSGRGSGSGNSAPRPELPALQILSLLQREGRLVDFLQQDVATFSDAEVGAAARVVHAGCRKALGAHMKLVPIRPEPEETKVTVDPGFDPASVKLTGNVQGAAPFRGTLRHKGWRVEEAHLPTLLEGHDVRVLAPAEVEL